MVLVALVAGCAGVEPRKTQPLADSRVYSVAPIELAGVRDQLASREDWRLYGVLDDTHALAGRLDRAFVGELAGRVRLDPQSPLVIVPALRLRDTAQFEGLAAETADAALRVRLVDRSGRVLDEVTFNAVADAPLARPSSRDQRLEAAMRQLADRYAQHLASLPAR
jgi:hypothetical protein